MCMVPRCVGSRTYPKGQSHVKKPTVLQCYIAPHDRITFFFFKFYLIHIQNKVCYKASKTAYFVCSRKLLILRINFTLFAKCLEDFADFVVVTNFLWRGICYSDSFVGHVTYSKFRDSCLWDDVCVSGYTS